jgi:low temperature requirement protein LtrA
MTSDPVNSDSARTRFFAIQACRWVGMVVAIVGLLALNGRFLPRATGYVLVPIGLFASMIAPVFLARRWRSRNP